MLGRMIFSCLVESDFLDTEAIYSYVESRSSPPTSTQTALDHQRQRLDKKLASFRSDRPINVLRSEILAYVRARANEQPGLFSLTIPTSGGKTLISLAFALDHAIRHGLHRVIFVIPFTSIVEQNAAVFRPRHVGGGPGVKLPLPSPNKMS